MSRVLRSIMIVYCPWDSFSLIRGLIASIKGAPLIAIMLTNILHRVICQELILNLKGNKKNRLFFNENLSGKCIKQYCMKKYIRHLM